jgi:hypothetical protein
MVVAARQHVSDAASRASKTLKNQIFHGSFVSAYMACLPPDQRRRALIR